MGPYISSFTQHCNGRFTQNAERNVTTAWRQSKKQDWETVEELYPTARNPVKVGEKYRTSYIPMARL